MNIIRRVIAAAIALSTLGLAGCASDRTKPPSFTFREQVRPLPVEYPLTEEQILERAASQPPMPVQGKGWQAMTDGKTLIGWRAIRGEGRGKVECRKGLLLLRSGEGTAGIGWTNEFPRANYEISLELMRVTGKDSFCGLTFPATNSFCTLILGGWGGSVVGLSDVDDLDVAENDTTQQVSFENGRWYRLRFRCTGGKIEAWLEQKKIVDFTLEDEKLLPPEGDFQSVEPVGFVSSATTVAFREIKFRQIPADELEVR